MTGPQRTPGYWQDDAATDKGAAHVEGSGRDACSTGPAIACGVPSASGPLTLPWPGGPSDQSARSSRRAWARWSRRCWRCLAWKPPPPWGGRRLYGGRTRHCCLRDRARHRTVRRFARACESKLQDYAVPQTIRVLAGPSAQRQRQSRSPGACCAARRMTHDGVERVKSLIVVDPRAVAAGATASARCELSMMTLILRAAGLIDSFGFVQLLDGIGRHGWGHRSMLSELDS